jgi:hypothetical protein
MVQHRVVAALADHAGLQARALERPLELAPKLDIELEFRRSARRDDPRVLAEVADVDRNDQRRKRSRNARDQVFGSR